MKKNCHIVLLFEDSEEELPAIRDALKTAMPANVDIVPFPGKPNAGSVLKGTYESRLLKDFSKELDAADLILCDQDLSEIPGYPGLSANVVISIARDEGIPIAIYGRGNGDDMVERLRQKRSFLERRFVLSLGADEWVPNTFARSAAVVFNGCREIHAFLDNAIRDRRTAPSSPAVLMMKILDRESIRTRLNLYGSGDQQYLENLAFTDIQSDRKKLVRILAAELGYWLWDSILRFPGIMVNATAAASVLNLSPASWGKTAVQALFAEAKYEGPFAEKEPYWWRDDLLRLIDSDDCEDGLALAKKKKVRGVERSSCYVDPKKPAGYYCMLAEKAVSLENSVGNVPYFPSGADLARISRPEFQKVAPWAGFDVSK